MNLALINLSKTNQDVNEKHDGNAHQEAGGTNAPSQVHVMASADNSVETRPGWVQKGNCTTHQPTSRVPTLFFLHRNNRLSRKSL
jgi:hypothetical protein